MKRDIRSGHLNISGIPIKIKETSQVRLAKSADRIDRSKPINVTDLPAHLFYAIQAYELKKEGGYSPRGQIITGRKADILGLERELDSNKVLNVAPIEQDKSSTSRRSSYRALSDYMQGVAD